MSTYLFIDGGYLRKRFADFTKRYYNIDCLPDLSGIGESLGGEPHEIREFDKAFYYDCFAEPPANTASSNSDSHRSELDESYISSIRAMPRWHVQEGRLVGGRKEKRGQKRVDVLLTVEMLSHAFAKNMNKAILIAGDDDFTPLVSELVRHGVYVEVWSDPRVAAKHLSDSADEYYEIRTWFHWRLLPQALRKVHPLPEFDSSYQIPLVHFRPTRHGIARNGQRIMIGHHNNAYHFATLENSAAVSYARASKYELLQEIIIDEFHNHPLSPESWEEVTA